MNVIRALQLLLLAEYFDLCMMHLLLIGDCAINKKKGKYKQRKSRILKSHFCTIDPLINHDPEDNYLKKLGISSNNPIRNLMHCHA